MQRTHNPVVVVLLMLNLCVRDGFDVLCYALQTVFVIVKAALLVHHQRRSALARPLSHLQKDSL